jgi:Nif-specific regulatory protein
MSKDTTPTTLPERPVSECAAQPCGRHHVRQIEALFHISKLIATRRDQQEMFRDILDVLERRLGLAHGILMLTTPDGRELVIEALRSDGSARAGATYRWGEGITGRVLKHGYPVVVPDVSEEPLFKGRIHGHSPGKLAGVGFVCVPIILGNETVGTLSVDVPSKTMELEEVRTLLCIVGGIIAHDISQRRVARMEKQVLEEENLRLRHTLQDRFRPTNIIGDSHEMREVFCRIHLVAAQNTTVLIRGESGTGKELVASAIHYSSPRAEGPFVKVNCAVLSSTLLESELFGHEAGAFTGAQETRKGRIEEANGGTLFLDELGDFSPAVQLKLLRVIQEREFERVGSNRAIRVDVRIIAATNRNLEAMVEAGTFRQDLYYRINVFAVNLPPLRTRRSDILLLANHFVRKYTALMNRPVDRISTPAIQMLMAYHWPGNVRELENCIEHALVMCQNGVIHGRDLPPTLQMPLSSGVKTAGNLCSAVDLLERDMITDALKRTRGNVSAAARELGITARMVRYKIGKLGIPYDRLFGGRRSARSQE